MEHTVIEDEEPAASPAVQRVNKLGRLLDESIPIPGTPFRVGIDPLLGVLPVAGDAVTTAISLYIVAEAFRAGVPRSTLVRMLSYVAVDAVVGSVPVLGTVFDAFWKANKWNARLFETHARDRTREQRLHRG